MIRSLFSALLGEAVIGIDAGDLELDRAPVDLRLKKRQLGVRACARSLVRAGMPLLLGSGVASNSMAAR